MPVKNAGLFLHETLVSIAHQTYTNWELVAVDDSSSDNSLQILQQAANTDSRIQVFRNNGLGIIPALAMAFANSTGTMITRMDADDKMAPLKLEQMSKRLENAGTGTVITGRVDYFPKEYVKEGFENYASWLNELGQSKNPFVAIWQECVIPSPCWMLYRSDLEKCGGITSGVYPEDYDLCFRFFAAGYTHAFVDAICHYWRDHAARASRNDPNYMDQTFFPLKVDYFEKLVLDTSTPLILWGAGKKGKALAKVLQNKEIEFSWVCNNPKKIGLKIYGVPLMGEDYLDQTGPGKQHILLAISGPEDRQYLHKNLLHKNLKVNADFFWFC